MALYIVSAVIFFAICVNFILGEKLYKEPEDSHFFNNVSRINNGSNRKISASPMYVTILSTITGIVLGMYFAYAKASKVDSIAISIISIIIVICYLIEITRKIEINDGKLVLSKFLYKTKYIKLRRYFGNVYL